MSAVHQLSAAASKPEVIGPGRLILVVGPSGAGKDTLIAKAKGACSHNPTIVFPRRVVTRPATDSEDHDSLKDEAFNYAAQNGVFAFWWQAHGLQYGIPATANDDIRAARTLVCNVSRGIVAYVRAHYRRVDTVLVTAPADILAERLAGRSRKTDGSLAQRIQRSDGFSEFRADYVIENIGSPELAARALLNVIHEMPPTD